MNWDDTLSLDARLARRPSRPCPQLFLVLQCGQPLALPSRHALLDVDEVVIGRGSSSVEREGRRLVIQVPDRFMSSTHARLRRSGDDFFIEDAQTKNGSFVNGQMHHRLALEDGDLVQLGTTFFSFRFTNLAPGDFFVRPPPGAPAGITTVIPELAESFAQLAQVAASAVPVTILGETGTGKELLARAVHQLSGRPGPLVAVNCGALPGTLLESELFGYKRGAFSGAVEDRPGLVRASDRGTLFLDEIGDLPLAAQPALLRVLQEREVTPVGATRPTPVDLRVVSATHRDLAALESSGGFRADLIGRLAGHAFRLPPLRERREDLGLVIATVLRRLAGDRADEVTLSAAVGYFLLTHAWPLNVRELEQCLAGALAVSGGAIESHHLAAGLPLAGREQKPPPAPTRPLSSDDEQHRAQLSALLERHGGNISAVARELGKQRIQIRRWIKRYGLSHS
jgi:transcriptional regulator of acetoin/glycerol metabolism